MIVAVLILVLLSWFFIGFRAFACFNLLIFGISAVLAVMLGADSIFMAMGVPMVIGGVLILLLTSHQVEKSQRIHYMVHLFLYGLFMFLRIMMIMMIITIPLVGMCRTICADYREMVIVDCAGRSTGRKVVVNTDTMKDAQGRSYDRYDPY